MIELKKNGLKVLQQAPMVVMYEGHIVGFYFADILVENSVIIELKVANKLDPVHFAQCLNYLRATNLKIGLLINFGPPRIRIKRVVNNF